jgi:hypothetical protein
MVRTLYIFRLPVRRYIYGKTPLDLDLIRKRPQRLFNENQESNENKEQQSSSN